MPLSTNNLRFYMKLSFIMIWHDSDTMLIWSIRLIIRGWQKSGTLMEAWGSKRAATPCEGWSNGGRKFRCGYYGMQRSFPHGFAGLRVAQVWSQGKSLAPSWSNAMYILCICNNNIINSLIFWYVQIKITRPKYCNLR